MSNNPQYGYNIDNGGNGLGSFSEEHIRKMKIAQNNPALKERKRQASLGEKNWFYGKKHSSEAREIMSKKARNRATPNHKKGVMCIETGEVFLTSTQAAQKFGVSIASIHNYCTGKRKAKNGKHFMFVEVKGNEY